MRPSGPGRAPRSRRREADRTWGNLRRFGGRRAIRRSPEGASGTVAIAVWDGATGNVGGRKHYSEWIEFRVEAIS